VIATPCADTKVPRNGNAKSDAAINHLNALEWLRRGIPVERSDRMDDCISVQCLSYNPIFLAAPCEMDNHICVYSPHAEQHTYD
jgi:hypothetical protein